jgi:predicted Zn-dependent peptidase
VRAVAAKVVKARLSAIREELAASYGISVGYHDGLGADVFEVSGDVNASQAGPAIARMLHELADLHDHGASFRADFVRARRAALGDALASDGSADDAVNDAAEIAAYGLPLSRLSEIPSEIAAVRPADVGALLAGDLDPTRMVVQISGPGARAAAAAAGLAVNPQHVP